MIEYNIWLNHGNENIGSEEKTITANEVVKTADNDDVAALIHSMNNLIPEQVARDVLENFCMATGRLMKMGFAVQLKSKTEVAMRIYPNVRVKGGNINLARAQELDPTVTDLTLENAADLVQKAGVEVRVKAECQQPYTDILKELKPSLSYVKVIDRPKVMRTDASTGNNSSQTPTVDTSTNDNPSSGDDGLGG